jgi:hypothetical protein
MYTLDNTFCVSEVSDTIFGFTLECSSSSKAFGAAFKILLDNIETSFKKVVSTYSSNKDLAEMLSHCDILLPSLMDCVKDSMVEEISNNATIREVFYRKDGTTTSYKPID